MERARGPGWPALGAANFVFTAPGQKQALVGLLTPSTDSLGRAFPLAVFTEVARRHGPALRADAGGLPALPPRRAALLARSARSWTCRNCWSAPGGAALPGPGDFSVAQRLRTPRWRSTAPRSCPGPVVEGTPDGGRYYALHTFLTACVGERGREQSPAGVALDCPFPARLGPVAWLELSSRAAALAEPAPAFFWSEGERPRLLLSLGAAPPALFLALAQPGRPGAQVWPLRTERPAAIDNARKGLKAAARQVIDAPSTTLEQLLRALAP